MVASFDGAGVAVVFGASGGIGAALVSALERAGHFLQLEQPETVGRLIVDFLGAA